MDELSELNELCTVFYSESFP